MDEMNRVREAARRDIQAFLADSEAEAADVLATGALRQQVAGLRNVLKGGRGADKPSTVQMTQKLRAASSERWQQINAGAFQFPELPHPAVRVHLMVACRVPGKNVAEMSADDMMYEIPEVPHTLRPYR